MGRKTSIERRHAKRIAAGWWFSGWRFYFDDESLLDRYCHKSDDPNGWDTDGKRKGFKFYTHTDSVMGSNEEADRMRDAFAHRGCNCEQCDAPRARRYLITRVYLSGVNADGTDKGWTPPVVTLPGRIESIATTVVVK